MICSFALVGANTLKEAGHLDICLTMALAFDRQLCHVDPGGRNLSASLQAHVCDDIDEWPGLVDAALGVPLVLIYALTGRMNTHYVMGRVHLYHDPKTGQGRAEWNNDPSESCLLGPIEEVVAALLAKIIVRMLAGVE